MAVCVIINLHQTCSNFGKLYYDVIDHKSEILYFIFKASGCKFR